MTATYLSRATLAPRRRKNTALGPTLGFAGSAMLNPFDFGESFAEVSANTSTTLPFGFCRLPKTLCLKSGVSLCASVSLGLAGADNTGISIICRRSSDKFATFSTVTIAKTSTYPATGGTNLAITGFDFVQRPTDGKLVMLIGVCVFGNTTAGTWVGFDGSNPPTTIATKVYVLTSIDNGATWQNPNTGSNDTVGFEITSQLKWTDKRNQMTIASAVSGTGSVYKLAVSGNPDAMTVGDYYLLRIASWSGTDHATINYAENGGVAFYGKCVTDAGHVELQGTTFVATGTGTALPQMTWMVPGGRGCALRIGGANHDRVIFNFSSRAGNGPGWFQASAQHVYADNADNPDLTVWHPSAKDTSLDGTISTIEATDCELPNSFGHIYCNARGSGTSREKMLSTDGGATFGATTHDTITAVPCTDGLIPVSGNQVLLVGPDQAAGREQLAGWLGTLSGDVPTWGAPRKLAFGMAGYTSPDKHKDGTILIGFEKSPLDLAVSSVGSQIGLIKTNVAAIQNAARTPDEVRYYFNEQASGVTAWTNMIGVRDWGNVKNGICLGQHAKVLGKPQYTSTGLQFGFTTTDGLQLTAAGNHDFTFAPDYLATDSGSFSVQLLGSVDAIPSSNCPLVTTGNPSVNLAMTNGAAKIGFTVEYDTTSHEIAITVSDGTSHQTAYAPITLSSPGNFNILLTYDKPNNLLTAYRVSDGSNGQSPTSFGSLTDASDTYTVRAAQYHDGTSNWSALGGKFTLRAFRFVRGVLPLASALSASPTIPTADTFDAFIAGGPDDTSVIPAANLDFHVAPAEAGFGCRGLSLSSRSPLHAPSGWPSPGFLDRSSNGYFATIAGTANVARVVSANTGGYWRFPGSSNFHTFNNPVAKYAYIHNFSSSWGIFWKMNLALASLATPLGILSTFDGTHGFRITQGDGGSNWIFFYNGSFKCQFTKAGGVTSGPFLCGITFNGAGGTGNTGLHSYATPWTSGTMALSDVTAHKDENLTNVSGSTASTSVSTTSALKIGDATNLLSGDFSDFVIVNGANSFVMSDANVLSIFNEMLLA